MGRLVIPLLVIFTYGTSHAQIQYPPTKEDIRFLMHLDAVGNHSGLEHVIRSIDLQGIASSHRKDSLYYLLGWAGYNQKKLEPSAQALLKVSEGSVFYHKSRFFAGYNLAHLNDFKTSRKVFTQIATGSEQLTRLQHFELAGLALLERDFEAYDVHARLLPGGYYAISKQQGKLEDLAMTLKDHRLKKPWLAAVFSTLLPGTGKMYAGKTGEGLSAMLITGSLGAVTLENYINHGIANPRTLIFGTIFSVFYAGNIIGSYFSVSIANKDFNEQTNREILFNMHIPLRTVFN